MTVSRLWLVDCIRNCYFHMRYLFKNRASWQHINCERKYLSAVFALGSRSSYKGVPYRGSRDAFRNSLLILKLWLSIWTLSALFSTSILILCLINDKDRIMITSACAWASKLAAGYTVYIMCVIDFQHWQLISERTLGSHIMPRACIWLTFFGSGTPARC